MDITFQIIIGIVIMVSISLFNTYGYGRKFDTIKSFYYGDDNLKVSKVVHLLLSTSFSMNGILYQTFLGFAFGWAALLIQAVWCASYWWLSSYSSRINSFEKNGTIHGTIAIYFGSNAAKIATLATIIGFTLQIGWELIVGSVAISTIAPNNSVLLMILIFGLAVISATYTILGGLKGNIKVNVFQNIVGGVAFIIIPIFFILVTQKPETTLNSYLSFDFKGLFGNTPLLIIAFLSNILFSLFWQFVDSSTWHSIMSGSNTDNTSEKALKWSSFWIFIFPGFMGTILGISLKLSNPEMTDPNSYIPYIITEISNYPYLVILFIMGCIGAMLSTLDGLLLSVGQVVSWDWFNSNIIGKILNGEITDDNLEKRIINTTRIAIFVTAIVGSLFSYVITQVFQVSIFDIVYIVTVAQMVLVPVIFKVLKNKQNEKYINAEWSLGISLLVGVLFVVIMIVFNKQQYLPFAPIISLGLSYILAFTIKKQDI